MSVAILHGSVESFLPTLAPSSFDAAFCDPPYGLGFMGKAWDHGVPGAPIWSEVARCLRPGAHLLAFGGTRTFHRLTVGIEDGGFEIRDCLAWLYGSGFPKSLDVSKAIDHALGAERPRDVVPAKRSALHGDRPWMHDPNHRFESSAPASAPASAFSGYGTALKPAWEPCVLAMKPNDGTFAANALRHGVAGLAIDAGRIAAEPYSYPNGPRGNVAPSSLGRRADGTSSLRREDAVESNPLGRWPANVLLDEEAAAALDARTEGGASRFFYQAKVSRSERSGSKHPTMKPTALCEYLARLLLPPPRADGAPRRILVPFSGAGSEIIGCLRAGWDEVVGIEREAEYVEDARRRIAAEFGLLHAVEAVPA